MVFRNSDKYQQQILKHYLNAWGDKFNVLRWDAGPVDKLPSKFQVLEFPPTLKRNMWTYATCCMSQQVDQIKIELHLFSNVQDQKLVELLTAVAYFHRLTQHLGLNHTVNFGRSWQDNSPCSFGLISLPYLDGPTLENLHIEKSEIVKFYWLVPLTESEVRYKAEFGVDSLEEKMEEKQFNYLDPNRASVI